MSIIGTFAVMYLLGYSLDNLSLMALTLCVGFVVDDAIVMLENIVAPHGRRARRRSQAALNGSREIAFTIVSMTLSLAAVFIPVLFMGGIARAPAARVRRHHHRRGAGVRVRVADAHADDVQPDPAARTATSATVGCTS